MLGQCTATWLHADSDCLRSALEAYGVQGVTVEATETGSIVTPVWSDEEGLRSLAFGLLHAFMGNPELRAVFL